MTDGMKLWIEELRSGKYVQGRIYMKRSFGRGRRVRYCALGLGYVAAKKAGLKVKDVKGPEGIHYLNDRDTYPDDRITEWLGLRPGDGVLDAALEVSHMNDNGLTFEEIADWLERRFGGGA